MITKSDNGTWFVVIELGRDNISGLRKRHKKTGFKTEKEAKKYDRIKQTEIDKGANLITGSVLLGVDIMDWYTNHIVKVGLSINTLVGYRTRLEIHIIPYLGNIPLNKINTSTIQKFYYHLMDKGMKPGTSKKVIQVLTVYFKYCKKLKLINDIPTDIELFKDNRIKNTVKAWSEEELIFFLAEIKTHYLYMPILLKAFSGVRVGELCGLRWVNVDIINNTIHIKEQVINDKINKISIHSDKLKNNSSYRSITLPPFVIAACACVFCV